MTPFYRIVVILALLGASATVLVLKHHTQASRPATPLIGDATPRPRLMEFGAGKCASCKMMQPILAELQADFANVFDVVSVDVWEEPDTATRFGIRIIPTQIFHDAAGNELFRHEGFFPREDILAVWRQHGVLPSDDTARTPDSETN